MRVKALLKIIRAMADIRGHRLKILFALLQRPMTVQELGEQLHLEQSNVSHHLQKLRAVHLVEYKKDGKGRCYKLTDSTAFAMLVEALQRFVR